MKKVADIMTKEPITISPEASLEEAIGIMLGMGIRHIPVVDEEGTVVGIISDRDVRLALGSPLEDKLSNELLKNLEHHTVSEMMSTGICSIQPHQGILEAAKIIRDKYIGCLPVIERGKLVGMLSYVDLLGGLIARIENTQKLAI